MYRLQTFVDRLNKICVSVIFAFEAHFSESSRFLRTFEIAGLNKMSYFSEECTEIDSKMTVQYCAQDLK